MILIYGEYYQSMCYQTNSQLYNFQLRVEKTVQMALSNFGTNILICSLNAKVEIQSLSLSTKTKLNKCGCGRGV